MEIRMMEGGTKSSLDEVGITVLRYYITQSDHTCSLYNIILLYMYVAIACVKS